MCANFERLFVQIFRYIPVNLKPGDVILIIVSLSLLAHIIDMQLAVIRDTGTFTRIGVGYFKITRIRLYADTGTAIVVIIIIIRALMVIITAIIE